MDDEGESEVTEDGSEDKNKDKEEEEEEEKEGTIVTFFYYN